MARAKDMKRKFKSLNRSGQILRTERRLSGVPPRRTRHRHRPSP